MGWGWLGFFAFTQINLEMECRGAPFIVAQLSKTLICSFCEGLGDNVPLAFTVAAHFYAMDTPVCFLFAHLWGIYVSFIYVVCFLCLYIRPPFFPLQANLIGRLINITASLSCGLGGLQLSVQMLRISHFLTAHNRGGEEIKHPNPRWAVRQGSSVYTKCSVAALDLHCTCF